MEQMQDSLKTDPVMILHDTGYCRME